MIYVFDNSPLSALFKNFYRKQFPTLWGRFDEMVFDGRLISTREVLREIEDYNNDALRDWCKNHRDFFQTPTAEEGEFVRKIFSYRHFQQNIELRKILKGGKNADPFVVSKAAVIGGAVVTLEEFRPNAVKIPNICQHFQIPCYSLEKFMETEGWEF